MGIEKEYQDPVELWSDLDDGGDDNLLLSLSSSDEAGPAFLGHEAHSQQHLDMDLPSGDFSLVTFESPPIGRYRRSRDELGLDLDVNMDRVLNASHAFGSPDAPASQTSPSRIQSLSPPAASGWSALREGPAEGYFPGLSSMQGQADLDFELSFDSDVDEPDSDAHHLEEFEDVLRGTTHLTEEGLEHQASNAGIGTDIGAGMDGVDEDEDFGIAYW